MLAVLITHATASVDACYCKKNKNSPPQPATSEFYVMILCYCGVIETLIKLLKEKDSSSRGQMTNTHVHVAKPCKSDIHNLKTISNKLLYALLYGPQDVHVCHCIHFALLFIKLIKLTYQP